MLILGIETSCDETAVALYDTEKGLLHHQVYTQTHHAQYGGIVPELASRDHIRHLLPMTKKALEDVHISLRDLQGVVYTKGPGLIGALLVGATFGYSLGWVLGIPTLGVHHMEGHLLASMLEEKKPTFPFLAVLVSGGHTLLVDVRQFGEYHILGESVDDAAGEAFDKTAKLLGLGYPGGPALAALASQGTPGVFHFPRPMLHKPGFNFSFSGLKTHVGMVWKNVEQNPAMKADIAYAFQEAVVDTLIQKTIKALKFTKYKQVVIAGGVGANYFLRKRFAEEAQEKRFEVYYPRLEFCTDNAAMIAYVGAHRLLSGERDGFEVRARWALSELEVC